MHKSPKTLLIISPVVDEKDTLTALITHWIYEFAQHYERVFVITQRVGTHHLPNNVELYSLGKDHGASWLSRVITFIGFSFKLVRKSDVIFCAYSPIYVIGMWPAAFLFGKKIVLWYLHKAVPFKFRVAEKMVYKIVTAAKESLQIKSNKIVAVGHGIDTNQFKQQRSWSDHQAQWKLVTIGRIAPIKDLVTLIEAAALLKKENIDFTLDIIGDVVYAKHEAYKETVQKRITALGLESRVQFLGSIPYDQLPEKMKHNDFIVSMTPRGGIDRTVLEGMAAGLIPVVSNDVFAQYFKPYDTQLIFKHGDAQDLAQTIQSIMKREPKEKQAISNHMQYVVETQHSVSEMIKKIVTILNQT